MNKKTSIQSTGYELRRYFTPTSLTASQTPKMKKVRATGPHVLPLTYQQLLEQQERRVQHLELNAQTAANRATALRTFLRTNALHIEDVVGSEMRLGYSVAIEKMIHRLEDERSSTRTISNMRSMLRHFRDAVVDYDTNLALFREQATPFVIALKGVMSDSPVKRVAKLAGVPPDMLRGWLLGKHPRTSSTRYLIRLESFFGLEKNSLVILSGGKPSNSTTRLGEIPSSIALGLTQGHFS